MKKLAIAAFVIGILSICSWFVFPDCISPLSIIGIILGVVSINSRYRALAITGIILSILGLAVYLITYTILGSELSPL
jgi:hypothetical protein